MLTSCLIATRIQSFDARRTCVYRDTVQNLTGIKALAFNQAAFLDSVTLDLGHENSSTSGSPEISAGFLEYLFLLDSDNNTYKLHIHSSTTSNILKLYVRVSPSGDYPWEILEESKTGEDHKYQFNNNSFISVQRNGRSSSIISPKEKHTLVLNDRVNHHEIVIFNASATYVHSWTLVNEAAVINETRLITSKRSHFSVSRRTSGSISRGNITNLPDFTVVYHSQPEARSDVAVGLFRDGTYLIGKFATDGLFFMVATAGPSEPRSPDDIRRHIVIANESCVSEALKSTYPYKNEWFYVLGLIAFIAVSCIAFVCVDFESETSRD